MSISNRLNKMGTSPIRKLSKYEKIAKDKGIGVIHLNIGQPDVETPKELLDVVKNMDIPTLKYTDSRGMASTIDAFRNYYKGYGVELNSEEILITNGGSEALLFAFLATCDECDEILVPAPFYTNYNSFAEMANVKLVPVLRDFKKNFAMPSKEDFEKHISPRTKAILFSNPCNPTGSVYTEEELRMLLDFAEERDLWVISDEVYREFIYTDSKPSSILNYNYNTDRIIVLDSISKRYSACGARIGLVASKNKMFMDNLIKLGQSRLSAPVIEQTLTSAILSVPKEYLDRTRELYRSRRDVILRELSKIEGVSVSRPDGAFYLIVDLPVKDSEDFAKWMLSEFSLNGKTLMVAPASKFYNIEGYGNSQVRLSYCVCEEELVKAAEILSEALKKYNNK